MTVRKLHGWALALLILSANGCSDSLIEPEDAASLVISPVPVTSLQVGDAVSLTATALKRSGSELTAAIVDWNSLAPTVASVTRQGVLTGVAPGSALIIAATGSVADTVAVTVVKRSSVSGSCSSQTASSITVGEIRSIAPGTSLLCLSATSADYMLIAANGSQAGNTPLQITGSGLQSISSQISASSRLRLDLASDGPSPDRGFESRLRATERRDLPQYLGALRASVGSTGPRLAVSPAAVSVGDALSLNVATTSCSAPKTRTGRVAAVTEHAIVVHDNANPAGGFTDAEYRQFGVAFDTLVYAVGTENFGAPADLDANGRVIIFYTSAVNALTERNSDSYVGGFFFSRDLFPRTSQGGLQGCTGSNYAEMFYLLAPDPTGAVNGNVRSKDFVSDVAVTTIAHEFQHLISASRRLYVVKTNNFDEDVWLNEGLSHIAEELTFYRAAGLNPGQNLTAEALRMTPGRRAAFNLYGVSNFSRLESYLESPESSSPFADDDELSTRGAAWAFLRYAVDRKGGNQTATWNALVNSNLTGFANLSSVLGVDARGLVRDWTASVFLDDVLAGLSANYAQPSWHYRSTFGGFNSNAGIYPLATRSLSDARSQSLTITAGGGSFIKFSGTSSSLGQVQLASGGMAPPSTLSLLLVRTR